jgi:SLT domain-containing protein
VYDPLSNLVAGIRYAVKRYGSLQQVPGVMAVNNGGAYVGYDSGGYLQPGVTQVYNGTGKPEPVFTDAQFKGMTGGNDRETKDLLRQLIAVAGSQGSQFADALNGVASNAHNKARGTRY